MSCKELAQTYNDEIIALRRWFHSHPEISGQEAQTTEKIAAELQGLGLTVKRFDGMFGCYADLVGAHPGPTVMLRADIDALATTERTGLPFTSEHQGVMHACGHDCHMAIQLGTAKILADLREQLRGTVRFFFQPEEELGVGAKKAVEQGVTAGVGACYGIHVWGGVESCRLNLEAGERMASSDRVTITVRGATAHASAPHLGKDAVVAASALVMNLQAVVSRFNDPVAPTVLTVATINGGTRFNTLPDQTVLVCSVRAFSREIRDRMELQISQVSKATAEAFGCTADVLYERLAGPIINDHPALVDIARGAAEKLYGKDFLIPLQRISASEDYSHIMDAIPSVFGFLGATAPDQPDTALSNHHERFTVDENTLHYAAGVAAQFALDYLHSHS